MRKIREKVDLECPECNTEYSTYKEDPKKFCSRKCYDKNRPKRSQQFKSKQKENALTFYQDTENSEKNKERHKNISVSHKVRTRVEITEEEYLKIKSLIELKYISCIDSIIKVLNLRFTYNEFVRVLDQNKELERLFKGAKHTQKCLRVFTPEMFKNLREDSFKYDHREIEVKYNLTEINFYCICQKFNDIRWGHIDTNRGVRETSIEKLVRKFLTDEGIPFQKEKYLVHRKYRVDCLLENKKVIEVNGDYWHANTEVYDRSKPELLTTVQKDNMIRDLSKAQWLKENNFKLLVVWEKDINTKFEEVKEKIRKFVYED